MPAARRLAPAQAQELTLEFQVTIGSVSTAWHAFGLRQDAQPGIDAFDLPEPPPPPGVPFSAYLVMFQPLPGLPNRWLDDLRPVDSLTSDRVELWQWHIESTGGGVNCRLDVREREPIGIPYDLYFVGSGLYHVPLQTPASYSFDITDNLMAQFFELRIDGGVPRERTSWGSIKSLFR